MSILGSNMLTGAAGRARYQIERSLRFNSGDSTYLDRTPGSAGNQKTWTWSAWVKRSGSLGSYQHLFNPVYGGDGVNEATIRFDNSDRFEVYDSGTTRGVLVTTQKFRDVSAWYHIVVALDTTQSTASNRLKLYVNGEQVTTFDSESYPSQNTTWGWNGTQRHDLGRYAYGGLYYFDGYMAEVNFVDGTALDASYFGETDLETGAWIPKKYQGSFGTNGFYLNFSDNSGTTATTLGKDNSGNSNNWTPNNFSVSAGVGNDSLLDTPTNNWCTLNPLNKGVDSITLSYGNLRYATSGTDHLVVATFAIPSSGKWYWEYRKDTSGTNLMVGIICSPETNNRSSFLGGQADGYSVYVQNGEKYNNSSSSTYMATPGTNSTITVAFDADNSKLYVGADGSWANGSGSTNQTFANAAVAHTLPTDKTCYPGISVSSGDAYINFGQRPFDHTPPAGYVALNAKNLPAVTIPDGTKYFNTVLFTGNGSTQSVTGVGFQPDWTWIKMRSDGSRGYAMFDSVRGGLERLDTTSGQEGRTNEGNISFESDGFNVTSSHPTVNDSSDTAVAWNWLTGSTAVNNGDGSTPSEVSVNPEAGLSIVTYIGTGSETTVGHGLGVSPDMIWVKNRDQSEGWIIDSRLITGNANGTLHFNTDAEYTGGSNQFGTHSSSIFTVKTSGNINTNLKKYVAYVFAEVEGYSRFGKFTGNGSESEGPYVHCGFKPAWILLKNTSDGSESFRIYDVKRDTFNYCDAVLNPNSDSAESTPSSSNSIDILSSGFKVRSTSGEINNSGSTILYMAFAEMPFKYANAR
tara:strand:+ start:13738 stop:16140 length:2403 start_codon:yes stop_codon:yes gene_type:complete